MAQRKEESRDPWDETGTSESAHDGLWSHGLHALSCGVWAEAAEGQGLALGHTGIEGSGEKAGAACTVGSLSVGSLGRAEFQKDRELVTANNSKRSRKSRQRTELWQDGRHGLPPAASWGFVRTRVCLGRREEKGRK